MSQENVELVRRLFDAWTRRDLTAVQELCDPELVVDRSNSMAEARIYRGWEEVNEFWEDWSAMWADFGWDLDEFIVAGDGVVVTGRFRGRGATSGAEVEANVSQVFTFRNGKLVRAKLFQNRQDALEAAGLEE